MAALGPVIDVDLGVPGDIFGDGFSGLDGLGERPGGFESDGHGHVSAAADAPGVDHDLVLVVHNSLPPGIAPS